MSDSEMEFSEYDRERLAHSEAWMAKPRLVESLCWCLFRMDPEGICPAENPRAATEYLTEVDMLIDRLPSIGTEEDLAGALKEIFCESFDETAVNGDWAQIAAVLWPHVRSARRTH